MNTRQRSPFKSRTMLAVVLVGFLAFLATLYFISVGDTGGRDNDGGAHAAAKGLNGYAGLVKLLELEGYDVSLSRNPSAFENYDLVVLTPPLNIDPDEFAKVLEQRSFTGPTLVILPKWWVQEIDLKLSQRLDDDIKVEDGWVQLVSALPSEWTEQIEKPFAFETEIEEERKSPATWTGLGLRGSLPATATKFALLEEGQHALVSDEEGNALALEALGTEESDFYKEGQRVIFVAEPDLLNNYGLADPGRAKLALELVKEAGYGEEIPVTFDLTLNGMGAAQNLLTLAFRPPFLAATLCLILALLVVGWRAFRRFGPPHAEQPVNAFGKSGLVANGAGLILRARRLPLLTRPYADLYMRRIARKLGVPRADAAAIDDLLARSMPEEEPFSRRADALRRARKPSEILGAAERLHDLERKLSR